MNFFFAVLYSSVFTPFLLMFLWLNTVLAKEIWNHKSEFSTNKLPTISKAISTFVLERKTKRRKRQIRIFKVIIVLMAVFLICRVPNWIFSVIVMNLKTQENIHWLLYFTFGLFALVNCLLNPFIYTFLSETIHVSNLLAGSCCDLFFFFKKVCSCKRKKENVAI